MSKTPLGLLGFSLATLGDGSTPSTVVTTNNGQNGLGVSYTISPPGTTGLVISYTIEQTSEAGLAISYLVGPSQAGFSINGDYSIPAPESMDYINPQQLGLDLRLGVVVQGYAALVWKWASLSYSEAHALLAHYDPQQPTVTITYPNDLGFWVARTAKFMPPQIGQRAGGESYGATTLTFTHLIPD